MGTTEELEIMAAKAANDNGHAEVAKKFKAFTTSVRGILTQAGKIIKDLRAEKAALEKERNERDEALEQTRQANVSLGTEIDNSNTEITDMWKKIVGGVAAVIVAGLIALLVVWALPTNKQVATTVPATPVLTQADITQIVNDQLVPVRSDLANVKKAVGDVQLGIADFNTRFDTANAAIANLVKKVDEQKSAIDVVTTKVDATKASADVATTAANEASKTATAAKTAADAASASAENLLGNTQKLATAVGQLAEKVTPGATASATAPATPAPATTTAPTTPATSFDWPADLIKRQTLVYTACAEVKDGWNAVDKTVSDQLLSTFTAAQAAKYFGEGGNCQAFLALATNATNIKKQLEASADEPGATQAAAPAPAAPARTTSRAPAPTGAEAPRRAQNGVLCPPLGSAKFLELNPKPQGEGWEMVENVPNQPCGGWHRKNYNMAERQQRQLQRQY